MDYVDLVHLSEVCICCKQHCDIVLYVSHTDRYFTFECTYFVTFILCTFVCVFLFVRACSLASMCEEENACDLVRLCSILVVKLTSQIIPLKWVGKT